MPGLSCGVWSPLSPGLGQAGGPVLPGAWSVSPPHRAQCRFPFASTPGITTARAEDAHTGGVVGLCPPPCPSRAEEQQTPLLFLLETKPRQQPGGSELWAASHEHLDPREHPGGIRVASGWHQGGWAAFRELRLTGEALSNPSTGAGQSLAKLLSALLSRIWVKRSLF